MQNDFVQLQLPTPLDSEKLHHNFWTSSNLQSWERTQDTLPPLTTSMLIVFSIQLFVSSQKLGREPLTGVCDEQRQYGALWEILLSPGDMGLVSKFIPCLFLAGTEIPEPGPIRLVGGPNRCAGRVEVLHEEQWGSVCHDSWDLNDAQVVCKQLGCGDAVLAPTKATFGQGSDTIWLDDVNCTGTEAALSECPARPWGDHNCYHKEDASAICAGKPSVLPLLPAMR